MNRFLYTSFLFALVLFGCNYPTKSIPETTPPPFLASIAVSPDSLAIITSPNNPDGTTDTMISLFASVDTNELGNIQTVRYSIISADGITILATGELSDNGRAPDVTAGDGKYASFAPIHVTTEEVGTYVIQIRAENLSGLTSSTLSKPFTLVNIANHAPQISNLIMPDTVFVPTSGSTTVKVSVVVSDSECLSDIKSVTLTSLKPDSSIVGTFSLFDDGSTSSQPPFNITSGDAVAGDGIYTLTIPLNSTTERNTYRVFIFEAIDRSGAVSNIISKNIYIE
jgi:hypothetical protein